MSRDQSKMKIYETNWFHELHQRHSSVASNAQLKNSFMLKLRTNCIFNAAVPGCRQGYSSVANLIDCNCHSKSTLFLFLPKSQVFRLLLFLQKSQQLLIHARTELAAFRTKGNEMSNCASRLLSSICSRLLLVRRNMQC